MKSTSELEVQIMGYCAIYEITDSFEVDLRYWISHAISTTLNAVEVHDAIGFNPEGLLRDHVREYTFK